MSKKEILQFRKAIENICGEANEAAKLSSVLFKDDELKEVRRELARLMEVVETTILPIYTTRFPSSESQERDDNEE